MIRWTSEPGIVLRRHPDAEDEPWLLHLEIGATNGMFAVRQQVFLGGEEFRAFGVELSRFPISADHRPELVSGSAGVRHQAPSISLAAYLDGLQSGLRCKSVDHGGRASSDAEVVFSIAVEVAGINRLGALVQEFADLKHSDLIWTIKSGDLFGAPQFHVP